MSALSYQVRQGALDILQTLSTLPPDFEGENYPAEVQVSGSGRFLYGSNRGYDSIVVFRIDTNTGRLTPLQYQPTGGKHPRHFAMDPRGRFLLVANTESDRLMVFRIDADEGTLRETGQSLSLASPAYIKFLPIPDCGHQRQESGSANVRPASPSIPNNPGRACGPSLRAGRPPPPPFFLWTGMVRRISPVGKCQPHRVPRYSKAWGAGQHLIPHGGGKYKLELAQATKATERHNDTKTGMGIH